MMEGISVASVVDHLVAIPGTTEIRVMGGALDRVSPFDQMKAAHSPGWPPARTLKFTRPGRRLLMSSSACGSRRSLGSASESG